MKLGNVRVGLINNLLFLIVVLEKDLKISFIRIVYVVVLKGLVIVFKCFVFF